MVYHPAVLYHYSLAVVRCVRPCLGHSVGLELPRQAEVIGWEVRVGYKEQFLLR